MPDIDPNTYWDAQQWWSWNGSMWVVGPMSGPGREPNGVPPQWALAPGGGLRVPPWAVMLGGGAVAAGAKADQFISLPGLGGMASAFGMNLMNPDALHTSFVCGLVIVGLGALMGPVSTRRATTILTRIAATLAGLGYGLFAIVGEVGVEDQQQSWFGTETSTTLHWSPALGLWLSIGGSAIAAVAAFGLNVRPRPSAVLLAPAGTALPYFPRVTPPGASPPVWWECTRPSDPGATQT